MNLHSQERWPDPPNPVTPLRSRTAQRSAWTSDLRDSRSDHLRPFRRLCVRRSAGAAPRSGRAGDDVLAVGIRDSFGTAVDVQLLQQVLDVLPDGLRGDEQLAADLFLLTTAG